MYNAQSPDEAALVSAARNFGYVFKARTPFLATVHILSTDVEVCENVFYTAQIISSLRSFKHTYIRTLLLWYKMISSTLLFSSGRI